MKATISQGFIAILFLLEAVLNAQSIQKTDADPFPTDKSGNQYGYSNESGYLFNTSKEKNLQVWGQNYFDMPSIIKKDGAGEIVWRKALVPNGAIWIYQLLLAKDGFIYIAGTLAGTIQLPNPKKKSPRLKLQANKESDEGNPFMLKLNTDGKLIFAVLLAKDKDSYRIVDKPELSYNKKSNQLTVKTEIRTGGGEDMPYLYRTYTVDALSGKVVKKEEKESGW